MKISVHAKERLFERYGIIFSRKTEKNFCQLLESGKKVFSLQNGKKACYFQGTWLLLCFENGTVKTFYPPSGLTEREKQILQTSGEDFQSGDNVPNIRLRPDKRRVRHSSPPSAAELPLDFDKAEEILDQQLLIVNNPLPQDN
ncbi:MAG: hypothetical protein LBT89_00720 [Planctomycetaceae bacterium]|jgi:hypothetical protein|nr:hypothetical protein [Planctomycetaceae bacterium]